MKVDKIIQAYLNGDFEKKGLEAGSRGLEKTKKEIEEEKGNIDNRFILCLDDNIKDRNKIIVFYFILLLVVFFGICLFIWNFKEDLTIVQMFMSSAGGGGLSIVWIISKVHQLYKDKMFTDHLLYMLPKMTTEAEKIKYMEVLLEYLRHKG